MKWVVLAVLLCSCAIIQSPGGFPFEEVREVDLLTEESCIAMMWEDRLDKLTIRAVSLKEMSDGRYRVLPKIGQVQFCDSYYILEDTTLCK